MGRSYTVMVNGRQYKRWDPSWYDWLWAVPLFVVLLPLSAMMNAYEWFLWNWSRRRATR